MNAAETPAGCRDLAYILAPSYTGSTLLTFLLARHRDIATVGELKGTSRGDLATYPCSCGALQRDCAFWKQVTQEMQDVATSFTLEEFGTHFRADRYVPDRLLHTRIRGPLFEAARSLLLQLPRYRRQFHDVLERNRQMIDLVCRLKGGRLFLDGSKDAIRLKWFKSSGYWNVKAIYLIRDGRGATNSYMRHYKVPMQAAAVEWRRTHEECDRVARALGAKACLAIHYEDLCRQPGETLTRIYDFLGLDASCIDESADHHVLGNQMRLKSLAEIKLDEKWKTMLTPEDLQAFERVAGPLNRRYGY